MVQIYLHAGLPKTGTTTLQNWLGENAPRLRAEGIFTFSKAELAHRLAVEGITSPERKAKQDIAAILKWQLEDAQAELRRAKRDKKISRIVLSSEYFSVADPAMVRQQLSTMSLDQVKIIIVLRRQDRLIESSYNQDVKTSEFTQTIVKAAYHASYDWDILASSWAKVFSPENLILRRYLDYVPAKGGIVSQIFGKLDPALAKLAKEHPPIEERSNASLPAALIEFKRLANLAGAPNLLALLEKASQLGVGGPPLECGLPWPRSSWIFTASQTGRSRGNIFTGMVIFSTKAI